MAGARDHTELEAWKLAHGLRIEVNRLVELRPMRFRPKLIEQLLDASESACSNLAEGFSRYLPRDFARFVRISKGSLSEVLDRLAAAVQRRIFSHDEIQTACSLARRARGACTGLIRYLETAEAPSGEPRNPRT
jgi:four helix bundle protein